MARTMGEVLPRSFPDLFGSVYGPKESSNSDGVDGVVDVENNGNHQKTNQRVLFVDVGSGYGTLCHAAVAEYGCVASLGIEKYREPLVKSDALMSSLDETTRSKIKIIHADVADCDLVRIFSAAPAHDAVLVFCNNLAMPPGARDRQAKQFAAAQREHAARVVVVSAVPLAAGFGDDAGKESCFVAVAADNDDDDGDGESNNGNNGGGSGSQKKKSLTDHAPHPLRRSLGIGMTFNDCHEVRVYEDGRAEEKAAERAVGGRRDDEGEGWGEIDADAVEADDDDDDSN